MNQISIDIFMKKSTSQNLTVLFSLLSELNEAESEFLLLEIAKVMLRLEISLAEVKKLAGWNELVDKVKASVRSKRDRFYRKLDRIIRYQALLSKGFTLERAQCNSECLKLLIGLNREERETVRLLTERLYVEGIIDKPVTHNALRTIKTDRLAQRSIRHFNAVTRLSERLTELQITREELTYALGLPNVLLNREFTKDKLDAIKRVKRNPHLQEDTFKELSKAD